MDSVALWFEEENENVERITRRILRDRSDILSLNDQSFIQNFRLNKDAFMYVLNAIEHDLIVPKRSTAIPTPIKVAAALKLLGQGGYQHQIGQDHLLGLSQQSMSRCLQEVCKVIERILCPKHIKFEVTAEEENEIKRGFFHTCGIPGVIGAVDGTHIQMIRPARNEHLYFNRNLSTICDHKMIITFIDCRYGGASHDSHVWALSNAKQKLKERFERGEKGFWLIGDSGYPLEPWLLTPYRNATENSSEAFYNKQFCKGRSIIERVFGVLKGRFRCLLAARELHYSPERVVQIMNVCCALHNICTNFNVQLPTHEIAETESLNEIDMSLNSNTNNGGQTTIAKEIRNNIRNNLISRT
ncbi:putative nuclease HARBI1 [Calliphora vicina]|uniref:putative nuclease HARBI1 n=1 Tax=Calliphora vicina TaxID=7373 RepID=UPI00325BB10C